MPFEFCLGKLEFNVRARCKPSGLIPFSCSKLTLFFHQQDLTYKIVNYTPKLTTKEVDDTIKKALDRWSNASQIKFKRVTDPKTEADILIKFVTGYHGDGRPADGPGKELAHAFFPLDNKGMENYAK